tara:strand:- start:592 stop:912 length:321 start_codon:yes stop_codon:yes gene_type:complete
MNSSDFYSALENLPGTYQFAVDGNTIVGKHTGRSSVRGSSLNPVTALAYRQTGSVYGSNKRETLRAGRALGLTREFTNHVYNATTGVSNRGNTQVVRGKIRCALGV